MDKRGAALQEGVQQLNALQMMLMNWRAAEERGYSESDSRRLDAIANLFAASNETLMTKYFKAKDE